MLYTSGTTAKPKGVPRRQRAERAAALAHVAQNLYRSGERTLGVMPLYHTMGVRSLLAMSLIGGAFVCLPRFDVARALELIEAEKITNLYLVPTLYHDLVHHERFKQTDVSSVRKIGFAGASMTDGLLKELQAAFKPELFVNHYGSSEIYTFTIDQNAPNKPGSAGRAGINQMVRVVRLGAASPDEIAKPGEEGEIIALLQGDESFEGYWRRPEADAKALRQGWYFTGDTGYVRRRRRPVRDRPGRRHDHHRRRERLAGRDRKLPVAARGGVRGRGGRPARRALGQGRHRLHQAQRARSSTSISTSTAAIRASPTSSGRAAMCSSRRSRNRRSASCCAACWWPANTSRNEPLPAHKEPLHELARHFRRPPPRRARRLPRRDRRGARARRRHPRPAAAQRGVDAAARPAPAGVREPRRELPRPRSSCCAPIGEHFSSGGNIKGFLEARPETVSKLAWNIAAPARCSKPVIAANRGFCFGVGFELSLACDFRIVSETGFYALPEQRLGQIPGSGGSARLQKIVGITRTKDIVMRSRRIPAKQAYEWGIATELRARRQARSRDRRAGR